MNTTPNDTNAAAPQPANLVAFQGGKPVQAEPQVDWFMIIAKVVRTAIDSLINAYGEEKAKATK